jgi:hypothetical protein
VSFRPRVARPLAAPASTSRENRLDASTGPGDIPDDVQRTGTSPLEVLRTPDVEITCADYCSYDGIFDIDVDDTLLTVIQCLDPYTSREQAPTYISSKYL